VVPLLITLAIVLLLALGGYFFWRQGRGESVDVEQAKQDFHAAREELQEQFFQQAAESGRPRGLAWKQCDFGEEVRFAVDLQSGRPRAFAAVTVSFEAIEGGGMEEVEAVGSLRAATAVFHHTGEIWDSHGRVLFNHSPQMAIERFSHEVEPV